jgi:hypothetical protein
VCTTGGPAQRRRQPLGERGLAGAAVAVDRHQPHAAGQRQDRLGQRPERLHPPISQVVHLDGFYQKHPG